jgi:hypothetical protein
MTEPLEPGDVADLTLGLPGPAEQLPPDDETDEPTPTEINDYEEARDVLEA